VVIEDVVASRCRTQATTDSLCAKAFEVERLRAEFEAEARRHAARRAERQAEEAARRAAVEAEASRVRAEAEGRRFAEERKWVESAQAVLERDPAESARISRYLAQRRQAAAQAEAARAAAEDEARRIISDALRGLGPSQPAL
jgi:hypothetical protein